MDFGENVILAEHHRRRSTTEADDVELQTGQDEVEARRNPRPDRTQGLGRDLVVVEDARLVEGDARRADQRPKFVFHRLIGRQYDEPDRGARGEAAVERRRKNAEVERAPGSNFLGGRE